MPPKRTISNNNKKKKGKGAALSAIISRPSTDNAINSNNNSIRLNHHHHHHTETINNDERPSKKSIKNSIAELASAFKDDDEDDDVDDDIDYDVQKSQNKRNVNGKRSGKPSAAAHNTASSTHNNTAGRKPTTSSSSSGTGCNSVGLYGIYKAATQRFKDGLAALVPAEIFAQDRVQSIMDAVDYLVDNPSSIIIMHTITTSADVVKGGTTPTTTTTTATTSAASASASSSSLSSSSALLCLLLEDCKTSLQFRKQYSKFFMGGGDGDEGHNYFISVLNYCYQCLRMLLPNKTMKTTNDTSRKQTAANKLFSFTDLELSSSDDDDSSEEEEEEEEETSAADAVAAPVVILLPNNNNNNNHKKKPKRPEDPNNNNKQLENLFGNTDRLQATLLMASAEIAMKNIAKAYKILKAKMRRHHQHDPTKTTTTETTTNDASFLVHDIMHCTVVTNMYMDQILSMEKELELDHPHLSSFYRILACVYYQGHLAELNKRLLAKGIHVVPPTELIALLGDAIENKFRIERNNVGDLLDDFCHKWKIPRRRRRSRRDDDTDGDDDSEDIEAVVIHAMVITDDIIYSRKGHQPSLLSPLLLPPNTKTLTSMFDIFEFIGGDRSILNTQFLIQFWSKRKEMADIHFCKKIFPRPGTFGSFLWNETTTTNDGLAETLSGGLDQFLQQEILSELIPSCSYGLLSVPLKRMDTVMPLFTALGRFAKNMSRPVPLSLTFGIHAMLTSIYELQGNNDVTTVATVCKKSYHLFFDQVEQQFASNLPQGQYWRRGLEHIMTCKDLPESAFDPIDDNNNNHSARTIDWAFWNPYCAGMFHMFLALQSNMFFGVNMINSIHQLQLVLHLYNGLRQRNLIQDKIPLLTSLDHYFEDVPAIWGGEKPKRDNLVKRLWYVYGVRAELIKPIYDECQRCVMTPPDEYNRREVVLHTRDGSLVRNPKARRAKHFSKTYKRIVLRDYSGIEGNAVRWNRNLAIPINDTLSLMRNERELLSWNLTAVGAYLNAFIYRLIDRLGWQEYLDATVASSSPMDPRIDPRSFLACDANKERYVIATKFADELLGPLEFLDSLEQRPAVFQARDCLVEYFTTTLEPSKYVYLNMDATAGEATSAG